ncbi:toll/interleukin-1 receptor domain-containing protein [Caballeronia telluris]|uniref:TPR domain-containing protein n=1 Tax=Caballeronia telluris TaxID=326475 RepID=A0A158KG60_9BURK|nr:toll/interleukin-1 receptor domain-containing protein [Caballeronia telluris]SAL80138.1 TPR domain-containing protein [Caballeronia telluris]
MIRVEKTVFVSYRRTNEAWALAISQNLTQHGYDVFMDFTSLPSGDFTNVILENIRARAHFLILLTPSALERCGEPNDWLRREIEAAIDNQRNIVPLMLEGFSFATTTIASQLTGKLDALKRYNGLNVPPGYFVYAMSHLREKFLDVPLTAVIHPASMLAQQAARKDQEATSMALAVEENELAAQQWVEQGVTTMDLATRLRCYSEAIRLQPDYFRAYILRSDVLEKKGDFKGALRDCEEAIRIQPDNADAYLNRGDIRESKGEIEGALRDYDEAIRLQPGYAAAYLCRSVALNKMGEYQVTKEDSKRYYDLAAADSIKFMALGHGGRGKYTDR